MTVLRCFWRSRIAWPGGTPGPDALKPAAEATFREWCVSPGLNRTGDGDDDPTISDGAVLIRDGLVKDQGELDALVSDLKAFDANPADARLAWRFGVGVAITDARIKLAELSNWLERKVLG